MSNHPKILPAGNGTWITNLGAFPSLHHQQRIDIQLNSGETKHNVLAVSQVWALAGMPNDINLWRPTVAVSDTQRLDWLQDNQQAVYKVTTAIRRPLTTGSARYEMQERFDGWACGSSDQEYPTIRCAIDAAMEQQA